MTLLSIIQDTADVVGLTRPLAVMTGTDQLSRQMLGFAKETLEELAKMGWPVLQVPYTFDTVVNQTGYDRPSDWGREVGDSVYGAARYSQLRGSVSAAEWAKQKNILPGLGFYRFRIYGYPLKIQLTPTPQVVESIVLEYESTDCVLRPDGTLWHTFTDDQDTTLFADDLMKKGVKWRIRRAKGMDYSEEFDDYEIARTQALAQQLQFGSMPVAYRSDYDYLPNGYVPENGFG